MKKDPVNFFAGRLSQRIAEILLLNPRDEFVVHGFEYHAAYDSVFSMIDGCSAPLDPT